MGVYGILGTSASGMAAQAERMSTMADNIANVSTTGYKTASTEFSTLVPQATTLLAESGSVETHVLHALSKQGSFNYTHSVTDLAINGSGFFVVQGSGGQTALTRAGAFVPDRDGNVVNAAGFKLLGYDLSKGVGGTVVNGVAGLTPVNLSSLTLRATPSTHGELKINLPSAIVSVAAADLPSTNSVGATYSAKTSMVGYDTLGAQKTLDVYFAKSATNEWNVSIYDRADAPTIGEFPYSSAPLTSATLIFDSSNGGFTSVSPTELSFQVPGGLAATLDLSKSTQLAGNFSVQSASINGNAPVSVERIEISDGGVLTAVYENGARIPSYRIPLGRVPSPDNMTLLSGNTFVPSVDSGDLLIGDATNGGAGTIVSGALELSTVDLASELTTMIEAQRSYTANSRVFQTGSELMDVIVNLKR